jgi:hypothetical protein
VLRRTIDAASLGLGLALSLLEGLTLADGETDRLGLGDSLAEGLTLALSELDGLTDALGLVEAEGELLGPIRLSANSDGTTINSSAHGRSGVFTHSCAPGSDTPGASDGLALALGLTLGLSEDEGETDADGLCESETDGLGLLTISRTAKWTMARSSEVPDDMPTERLPWPAVVSRTPTNPIAPVSMLFSAVELAPAVGSVWCPKWPNA